MAERLHFHFSLSCTGEGNGNPLQCSCLENPRDGGAWWAAVYGVTKSRTRLKWLSSSSSQSRPILCNPMDCSLPGSSIRGICQARILEWGAIAFSEFCHLEQCKIHSLLNKLSNIWNYVIWAISIFSGPPNSFCTWPKNDALRWHFT